jgi:UDP-glucose 4-epimerase
MNILVTGGAGFIGSHLCDHFLKNNKVKVSIVDDLSLGKKGNIEHLLSNPACDFYHIDILQPEKLEPLFEKKHFDVVFHLAANSDIAKSFNDPSIDLKNTFLTTFNILNLMRIYGVNQIVFASTSAIYGFAEEELFEDHGPLFPVSHYGAGKLASEAFISSFCENYNIKAWIFRFPNVVGERATHGIIFDFLKKLKKDTEYLEVLGDGEQNKPYVYVHDLVEAITFAWEKSSEHLNYFNIGVESHTKVKTIAKIVLEETKQKREIRYTGGNRGWIGDVPFFSYNLDKIHHLGWKAQYSSDEAVRIAVKKILETQEE